MDEVKRVAALALMALAAVMVAGLLVAIGISLFLGEALFGSLGWGVLHGSVLLVGVAIAAVLLALGLGGGRIGMDLLLAVIVGAIVGVALGLDLTNRGWTAAGDAVAGTVAADVRPLVVAAGSLAIVGAVLGLIGGARGGGMSGAFMGGLLGAIGGGLLGVLTAVALGPRVGAAVGVTAGLIAWPAFMGLTVARRGIDAEALQARFVPRQTIETTKETIEWVRERTPLGRRS